MQRVAVVVWRSRLRLCDLILLFFCPVFFEFNEGWLGRLARRGDGVLHEKMTFVVCLIRCCHQQHTFQQPPPRWPSTTNNVSVVSVLHARNVVQILVHNPQLHYWRTLYVINDRFLWTRKHSVVFFYFQFYFHVGFDCERQLHKMMCLCIQWRHSQFQVARGPWSGQSERHGVPRVVMLDVPTVTSLPRPSYASQMFSPAQLDFAMSAAYKVCCTWLHGRRRKQEVFEWCNTVNELECNCDGTVGICWVWIWLAAFCLDIYDNCTNVSSSDRKIIVYHATYISWSLHQTIDKHKYIDKYRSDNWQTW
jgi:hypothetical protein